MTKLMYRDIPLYRDIPQMVHVANYALDIGWEYLPCYYAQAVVEDQLDVNPNFQRHYVWTAEQKVRYVEYILRGGPSGKAIYTNCPGWRFGHVGPDYSDGWYVLVDGKQRLDAVLGYLNNEFPIFGGSYHKDYGDHIRQVYASFRWHINDLASYKEVLQWYIDLNSCGTIHSDDEINRVKALMLEGIDSHQ
jgi:hypothetical protein